MATHTKEEVETMTDNAITSQSSQSQDGSAPAVDQKEARTRHLKLYRAAFVGDWDKAKGIYDKHKEDISVTISIKGDTALHIAATVGHTYFVKQLVERMDKEDLSKTNDAGNTALCLAAASGEVEIAKAILKKGGEEIAKRRNNCNSLPIHMAAALGERHMVQYLYHETKDDLGDEDRIDLLVTLINSNLYDVALKVFEDCKKLATARDGNKETALHALARKPLTHQPGILRRCFNLCAKYSGNKKLQADAHALELLVEGLWKQVIIPSSDPEITEFIKSPRRLIFDAVEQGNVEFLSILVREYPDVLWKVDERGYTIFHNAVLNRQEDIFNLIYEIGSTKDLIVMIKDEEKKNNILHLAGMLAPPNRLNIVSGAALQLQRELLWFQGVEEVVQPLYAEAKNKKGLTPKALFTKSHEGLRQKGEKWMKDTASSCMLVATLIATVVFAAALTVPGGYKGDTGFPTFIHKDSFQIFAISNAMSMVFASASIVNFLSILTSRYAEEDFLSVLPRKLLFGLATLFISITAMMVVFSTTFYIVFKDGMKRTAVSVTVIASTPVILFIYQHYRLFYDVLRSTYVSDSLFKPGKKRLFPREGNKLIMNFRKSKKQDAHSTISTIV